MLVKRQFWGFIIVVKRGRFGWLLGWLKEAVLGCY